MKSFQYRGYVVEPRGDGSYFVYGSSYDRILAKFNTESECIRFINNQF